MKICENREFKMQNFANFLANFANFLCNACKICKKFDENLLKFCEWSGAKEYQSDRSRQELSNEYLVAKSGFDTAENEPLKAWITDQPAAFTADVR